MSILKNQRGGSRADEAFWALVTAVAGRTIDQSWRSGVTADILAVSAGKTADFARQQAAAEQASAEAAIREHGRSADASGLIMMCLYRKREWERVAALLE